MTRHALAAPLLRCPDQHLTCRCGAVLIPDFARLVADAPDVFSDVAVPCVGCGGLGRARLGTRARPVLTVVADGD